MIYQKNPESDATQPTGEHISIVVFSPLKIINPNIGWVCFCAVQVKPAFKTWLFFFSPFEICLEKTKLISMLYGGHTTFFFKNDLTSMLDARAHLWWVVQVHGLYFGQFVSGVVENLPFP